MSFEKEYSEATEVSTLSLSLFPPAIVKFIHILRLHLSQCRPETSTGSEFLSLLRISEFFRFI